MGEATDVLFDDGKAVGLRCRRCGAFRALNEQFCQCERDQEQDDLNEVWNRSKVLLNEKKGEYADAMRL